MSGFKFICQSCLLKTLNPRPRELRRCTTQGGPHQTGVGEGLADGSLVWARVCLAALSLAKFIKHDKKKRTNKAAMVNADKRPAMPSEGIQRVNNCAVCTVQTRRVTKLITCATISSVCILNSCGNHRDKITQPWTVRLLTDGSETEESGSVRTWIRAASKFSDLCCRHVRAPWWECQLALVRGRRHSIPWAANLMLKAGECGPIQMIGERTPCSKYTAQLNKAAQGHSFVCISGKRSRTTLSTMESSRPPEMGAEDTTFIIPFMLTAAAMTRWKEPHSFTSIK